ncbi:MAG: hypothetical protein K5945_03820 [Bacteroidaceae bacterium]|nr:hypothetical protein [Bacteroidaceae bacterium]
MADNKKEQQEQMHLIIEVLTKEEVTRMEVPAFLLDDDAATSYCRDVINHSDEQYAEDTTSANRIIDDAEWIIAHEFFPDEKIKKKLVKQGTTLTNWTKSMLGHTGFAKMCLSVTPR